MIMVGDRKQAIYGFRGGDMLTFLNAHQDIMRKQGRNYKLVHNHRSVRPRSRWWMHFFNDSPILANRYFMILLKPGSVRILH